MGFEVFTRPNRTGRRPSFDHAEAHARFEAGEDYATLAVEYGVTQRTMRLALWRRGARVYGTGRKRAAKH